MNVDITNDPTFTTTYTKMDGFTTDSRNTLMKGALQSDSEYLIVGFVYNLAFQLNKRVFANSAGIMFNNNQEYSSIAYSTQVYTLTDVFLSDVTSSMQSQFGVVGTLEITNI